jgi:hypothetical protein
MSTKFEQLLDYLVNEEMDKANELFHEIVVEKSREIYENMIAEEAEEESVEEADDAEEESVEEADDDQEESVEEGFGMDDEGDETSMSIGGENDPADSFASDTEAPEMGDEEGTGEVSTGEEKILDILAQLKSEFEEIVQQNGGEKPAAEPEFDDEEGEEDDGEEEDDFEAPEEEPSEEESMGQPMREYVENVGMNWDKGNTMKTPGPVGSGTGDKAGQTSVSSTKSPVSSGKGKPTTGATAGNILGDMKSASDSGTGTSPNAKVGGFLKNPQAMSTGNQNVPGGKVSVKGLTKVAQNSKTPGPVGSGTGDKAGQTSVGVVKSPLNGAPNRNA